jgi:hypothetical protein
LIILIMHIELRFRNRFWYPGELRATNCCPEQNKCTLHERRNRRIS